LVIDMPVRWKKTEDKVGLRPAKPLVCPHCVTEFILEHQRFPKRDEVPKLFLRSSTIKPLSHNPTARVNDMTFKCEECDAAFPFGRPMDFSHALATKTRRGGEMVYLPIGEWKKNKILKARLKALGYC